VIAAIVLAALGANAVPGTMQPIAMDAPGGVEVLTLRTLPVPAVDAKDVLVEVHSAGVAVWDLQIRNTMRMRQRRTSASKPAACPEKWCSGSAEISGGELLDRVEHFLRIGLEDVVLGVP
jgi:hypothetical protein